MKRLLSALLASLLLISALASCAQLPPEVDPHPANTTETQSVTTSYFADTFDDRLLSYIAANTEGSYMLSPLSLRYALGLLLAGAEGETKTELLAALGVESVEEYNAYCRTFNGFVELFDRQLADEIKDFESMKATGYATGDAPFRALRVANSIWKREDIAADFCDAYKATVAADYRAETFSFNLSNVIARINAWASEKTEKMIPELLPKNYNTSNLAVVLMNALYFKDAWSTAFPKYATADGDFTTEGGKTVTKTYMKSTENYRYYADGDTELVVLPMEGGVSMAFVLGSTENLGTKIDNAKNRSVTVTIPKIDLETSFANGELVDFLKGNGVRTAFTDAADFSGMLAHDMLVSDIIQKTRLKLDEDGVEAAAVTAIMTKDSGAYEPEKPIPFTADRPFSFFIYTTPNETTALLFAGEITE